MGFSVSGSAALIFLGFLATFGMVYTATSNGYEQVSDANADVREHLLDQQNTALNITNATFAGNDTLHVYVNNTGSTTLSVAETDVIVDNEYLTGFDYQRVDGATETDLWLPGETLHVRYTYTPALETPPSRVRVVTATGVAATEVI